MCLVTTLIPLAGAVHGELHGHTAPLRGEAKLSGAGGEVMRTVGIWGGFSGGPGKQQLSLNTGKKTLMLILKI